MNFGFNVIKLTTYDYTPIKSLLLGLIDFGTLVLDFCIFDWLHIFLPVLIYSQNGRTSSFVILTAS